MEASDFIQPETMHLRASSNPSFRSSSKASFTDMTAEDFHELCKARLKISKRNLSLQLKIKGEITSPVLPLSISELDQQNESDLQRRRTLRDQELQSFTPDLPEKFDLLSPFVFFLVKEKHLAVMIPDFEIYSCRDVFLDSMRHEAYFGLARLFCYEARFNKAVEYLNMALEGRKDDIYEVWKAVATVKVAKIVENEDGRGRSFISDWLCCGVVRRNHGEFDRIFESNGGVEKLWCCMELAMKGVGDQQPEYFASKIREADRYYGYLAWSEVFFRKNQWQNGLDILKQLMIKYEKRPEAYVKLWYHYYYNVKDYEQSESILLEAFLMIPTQDFSDFYILFSIYLAKTLEKLSRIEDCADLLQRRFMEHPTYPVFLYYYGKICTRSEDYLYNGTSIGLLHECIRLCDTSKYGQIYFWLTKAYILGRQCLEAYSTSKLALKYLNSSRSKKIGYIKHWLSGINPDINKIEEIESILSNDLNSQGYKRCKELCIELKDDYKLTVDVLHAKMLWKTGRHEEALKKLFAVSGISTVKMSPHFLLIKYLREQKNLKCMKTIACEMVLKCKNPQVPAHIWVQANLLYAKILVENNSPTKAILILKLLAKILPPLPFASIEYTKLLQRATNLQDLASAHTQTLLTSTTYNYSTYKNSFINPNYEVRDFSHKLLAEEDSPFLNISRRKFYQGRRSERYFTEKYGETRYYCKKKTHEVFEDEVTEKHKNVMLGVLLPSKNERNGLSVCSDPHFLYKIAKIAVENNVMIRDGYCAIRDYIELLKFEKSQKKRAEMMGKAETIKKEIERMIN